MKNNSSETRAGKLDRRSIMKRIEKGTERAIDGTFDLDVSLRNSLLSSKAISAINVCFLHGSRGDRGNGGVQCNRNGTAIAREFSEYLEFEIPSRGISLEISETNSGKKLPLR